VNAIHLLEGLRDEGVTFYPEPGDVITLMLPLGQRLQAMPVAGRSWARGLHRLVQEFDDYLHLLTDCAQMPLLEAEELAWAMLLAGYTAPPGAALTTRKEPPMPQNTKPLIFPWTSCACACGRRVAVAARNGWSWIPTAGDPGIPENRDVEPCRHCHCLTLRPGCLTVCERPAVRRFRPDQDDLVRRRN
jgi:hypothetical protein